MASELKKEMTSIQNSLAKCSSLIHTLAAVKKLGPKIASMEKAAMSLKREITTLFTIKELPVGDRSYTRFPKLHIYDDDNHYELFSDLASEKKVQVGDLFIPRNDDNGIAAFIVGRNGKLEFPLMLESGELGVPAWVIELGMEHSYTLKKLLNFYVQMNSCMFCVYPESMQKGHLAVNKSSGNIEAALAIYVDSENDIVLSKGNDIFDDLTSFKYANVFLGTKVNGKSASLKSSKSSKASKSSVSGSCAKQTTKKYTDRPSPPFPAADCPRQVKKGNNGKTYESVANVKGIYSWKVKK